MTLKIEAGKFYRTRNGRKVGPMQPWGDDSFHAGVYGVERVFEKNTGKHRYDDQTLDIIAEWVNETTEPDEPPAPKPYLVPFKPNQRLSLEPIANGGWIVSAASPYYGQETERLGAFGSAGDMLSALHDALTVRNGGNA